jgi:hypothetical protein
MLQIREGKCSEPEASYLTTAGILSVVNVDGFGGEIGQ